jgi:alanine dehydrogenase
VLCDGTRSTPLAVLESGLVTRLRTGAATAVAAKYLARLDSRTVTICGAGIQGEIQLRALKEVLPLNVFSSGAGVGAPRLAAQLHSAFGIDAQAVSDLGQAVRVSDVIITCTAAKGWFLGREHVSPGAFICAVGSDSPDKQEIEQDLLAESSVVPDLLNQAAHVGDLHHAIAAGLMQLRQIRGELGAVIAGLAPRRADNDEIIIFDSTGTALQDAVAVATVYEQALGRGQSFACWD